MHQQRTKNYIFLNPQTSFSIPTWGLVDYVAVKLIILSKVLDESWETLRHDKLICQTESGRATWSHNIRKIGPLSCFLLSQDRAKRSFMVNSSLKVYRVHNTLFPTFLIYEDIWHKTWEQNPKEESIIAKKWKLHSKF